MTRTTDSTIASAVTKALAQCSEVDSIAISASVEGPTVTLQGTVGSYAERLDACSVASRIPGVERVDNQITVRPYGTHWQMTDEDIMLEVAKVIVASDIRVDDIDIQVSQHVVTLRGRVFTDDDRRRLRHAVESATGVEILRNLVEIQNP